MNISYLGWGSLIWDPRELPVRRGWFEDGPLLPVEFCRQSQNDRITLVLVPGKPMIRVLWGLCSAPTLEEAVEALRAREGIPVGNRDRHIGRWARDQEQEGTTPEICAWVLRMGLYAAVWTNLPPKFDGSENLVPSAKQVVEHLDSLAAEKRRNAEAYIRRAPKQIDTDYRRLIESKLGWIPIG